MKKAFTYLDSKGVKYTFHDYKKESPDATWLTELVDTYGVDTVINKKGITWKKLAPEVQKKASTTKGAVALMIQSPSMIKRPIVIQGKKVIFGFDSAEWDKQL
ncbi:MAG: Spx/MgsR family RNA polymerase-binding regulatory protein [Cytophagaceae bacterium]|nr:Spx/MgsR family RNA polymerase-binding regulatory protein [Cytophagaceae bacterium]